MLIADKVPRDAFCQSSDSVSVNLPPVGGPGGWDFMLQFSFHEKG